MSKIKNLIRDKVRYNISDVFEQIFVEQKISNKVFSMKCDYYAQTSVAGYEMSMKIIAQIDLSSVYLFRDNATLHIFPEPKKYRHE